MGPDYTSRELAPFALTRSERALGLASVAAYVASTVKLVNRDPLSPDTGAQAVIEVTLLALALFAAAVPFIRRGGLIPRPTPPVIGFAAFAALTMLSAVSSWWMMLSVVKACLLIAVLLIALFLCVSGRPRQVLRYFYWCSLIAIAFGICLGLASPDSLFELDEFTGRQRLHIFGWHPLNVADVAALTILIGQLLPRRPHWALQIFLGSVLFLTGARATGIALMLVLVASSLFAHRDFRMKAVVWASAAAVGLVVCLLLVLQIPTSSMLPESVVDGYFGRNFGDEIGTLNGRTDLWRDNSSVIIDSAAFGYGLDGSRAALLNYADWSGNAHNAYAEIVLAGGIPALVVFFMAWGTAIVAAARVNGARRRLALSVYVFMFIAGLTNPTFTGLQFLPLFLIVCVDALIRDESRADSQQPMSSEIWAAAAVHGHHGATAAIRGAI